MKTYFIAILMMALPCFLQSQAQENTAKLKQIKIVKTNFRNLKSGEIVNKNILFKGGKISTIKTSDIIQSFFYNQNGLLDMSVKEREGSSWKEVINYSYDKQKRLLKLEKKYEEAGELVSKTVSMKYEGARIKATTRISNNNQNFIDDIEYVVADGCIVRRTSRDRNQQIINKTEYAYYKDNIVRHKGLVGDKSMLSYTFDDKNSVNLLIVKNLFGENYKIIVPIVSFHETEFDFQSISNNNELIFKSTSANHIGKTGKYKYNNLNYPISYSLLEDNGIVKTEVNYFYE